MQNQLFVNERLNKSLKFYMGNITNLVSQKDILCKWRNFTLTGEKHNADSVIAYKVEFLNDVFSKVLGYKIGGDKSLSSIFIENSQNEVSAKLGFFNLDNDSDIRAVVIIKDIKTDLDSFDRRHSSNMSAVQEAFFQATKSGDNCRWVIVTNFREIRLYQSSAITSYQKFDLGNLGKDSYLKKFIAIMANNRLFLLNKESPVDRLIKEEITTDKDVINDFYLYCKSTRVRLFNHLCDLNKDVDKIVLLSKSQKIINRVIFICFAQNYWNLPTNIIKDLEKAVKTSFIADEFTLWNELRALFSNIEKGNKNREIARIKIELFKDDVVLNNLIIKNDVIEEVFKIDDYNFVSDLNIYSLMQVFDKSVTDLSDMYSDIVNGTFGTKKSKRQKDDIFYAPNYITDYLVQDTIGSYLEKYKEEIGFYNLEDFTFQEWKEIHDGNFTDVVNKELTDKITLHVDMLVKFRTMLRNIKILDMTCGAGSFLLNALTYLRKQDSWVNAKIYELRGVVEPINNKQLLSNNIFGVDINPEAVELTKLILWLKTLNNNEELEELEGNIKCGNAIIDDKLVDEEHYFIWEKKFREPVVRGGFDIVIGYPPSNLLLSKDEKTYCKQKYRVSVIDTACLFMKNAMYLLNKRGVIGLLVPKDFCFKGSYRQIRNYVYNHFLKLVDCGKIWENNKQEKIIIVSDKSKANKFYEAEVFIDKNVAKIDKIEKQDCSKFDLFLSKTSTLDVSLAKKIKKNSLSMYDIVNDYCNLMLDKEYLKEVYEGKDSLKDKLWLFVDEDVNSISKINAFIRGDVESVLNKKVVQLVISSDYSVEFIWAIINSNVMSWYINNFVYGSADRRINFDELLAKLPIPSVSAQVQNSIMDDVRIYLTKAGELKGMKDNFIKSLTIDFPNLVVNKVLKDWYFLSSDDFKTELSKQKIDLGIMQDDWVVRYSKLAKFCLELNRIINITQNNLNVILHKLYDVDDKDELILQTQIKKGAK